MGKNLTEVGAKRPETQGIDLDELHKITFSSLLIFHFDIENTVEMQIIHKYRERESQEPVNNSVTVNRRADYSGTLLRHNLNFTSVLN